ncbi:ABC transporter substrate-binding protein [Sphingomonas sp.]|uniref:ABC transporter substrate-binding protein n=1 Tax=Sphingomonas sp. TaxID=28214 RepID=UPI003B00CD2E
MPRVARAPYRRLLPLAMLCLGAAPAPPRRVVSLNLCADQYLLALADRGQVAALTRFSRDPLLSAGAGAARAMPVSGGGAEEVLALDPDLVLAAPGQPAARVGALSGRHPQLIELPPADSYAAILGQVRTVAVAVGHSARGEALVARMNAALAALPPPRRHGVAAYYQRRGYVTGAGTLVDELMRRVGLVNLATRLGRPALSQLTLEQLVAARPDYLIVESASDRTADQGTEMLHHPVLAGIPRLRLPQAWTVCGGPAYVLAAQSLTRQLASRATRR